MAGEADLKRISDELAIHKVLAEYCLRLEVEGFDHWLDIFTEDTVYLVYGRTLDGREAMAEMLSKAPHGLHMGGPSRIEVKGDVAETIQSYLIAVGDVLYVLDFLEGHTWAREHVSHSTRAALKWPEPRHKQYYIQMRSGPDVG